MNKACASIVAVLVAASCRDSAPPVRVRQLLIDGALGGEGVELDKPLVRDALQRALAQSRRLRLDERGDDPGKSPSGDATVRVRAVAGRAPPDATGRPVVVLQLKLEAKLRDGRPLAIEAVAEARGSSAVDRADELVLPAARSVVDKIEQQLALGERPTSEVVAALRGGDRELRLRALALLAERKDPAAYDALVTALEDDDAQVALRAVGALVALGDPRAVNALTELTHRKSAELVRQIVYAVGAIGGREAEAYLFTVANGHPDPEVQRAAQVMLKEMAARGASPIASP